MADQNVAWGGKNMEKNRMSLSDGRKKKKKKKEREKTLNPE